MNGNCYILCAAGYAETSVQQARLWLQKEGIEPVFLGLKSGSILGSAGGTAPVEALISYFSGEEAPRPLPDGLLLAGGAACGRQLLTDPRVHLLVQQMQQAAHPVGLLHPLSYALVDLLRQQTEKRPQEQPLLLQEARAIAEFMNSFVQQLHQAGASKSKCPTG